MTTIHNKIPAITATVIDLALLLVAFFTSVWDNEQLRFLLSMGILLTTLVAITGFVRWYKFGPYTVREDEHGLEEEPEE